MSKPMNIPSGARSLSKQQSTDQKKPCDICCDLDPLCLVEPNTTTIIDGNGYINLFWNLGAYKTSAELGCPICRLLTAVFDRFWPGQTRDAQAKLRLEENEAPDLCLWAPAPPLTGDMLSVHLYTSTRLGKYTLFTQRSRSTTRDTRCY